MSAQLQIPKKCLHVILELSVLSKKSVTYKCDKCEEEFEVDRI